MTQPDASKRIPALTLAAVKAEMEDAGGVGQALAGVCAIAAAGEWLLSTATRLHWLAGAAVSLALAALYWQMRSRMFKGPLARTRGAMAVTLSLGLLLAVILGGWLSYLLHAKGLAQYALQGEPSLAQFMRLYFFTFGELLPLVDVTKTLQIASPVSIRSFWGGVPVLAFKVFVLLYIFEAFRSWSQARKDAGESKPSDLALLLVFLLTFVVTVLARLPSASDA
jgi:hypothetical protein